MSHMGMNGSPPGFSGVRVTRRVLVGFVLLDLSFYV